MELMKMTRGSSLLPGDTKKGLAAMQERLGIRAVSGSSGARLIALVFDATGSMCDIWREAKANICKLIARQKELSPQAKFVLVAYRDYCDGNDLLAVSTPSAEMEEIVAFLDSVSCEGGGDIPEAVEAALEKVAQLKPDMAILVGDAPPHGVEDKIVHGDYRENARELGAQKIPVYTITTTKAQSTMSSFGEIADLTKGRMFHLSQVDDLIDLLSVVAARESRQLSQLAGILKKENGGHLTAKQEYLLLEAGRA